MTKEIDKRPIHSIYKAVSDKANEGGRSFDKALAEALETKDYSVYQKLRAEGHEQSKKLPQPELIHLFREVTGGPDNVKVKLEIFRPVGSEDEFLPIILYTHGGGFVFCDMYAHKQSIFKLAVGVHAVVVFVDYSLSPEAQFPIATEEVFAALCWVRENAASINGDPEKIAVLADSAGGNLSAAVSLMAKDRGLGDAIKAQVLIYPTVSVSDDFPSLEKYGQGGYFSTLKGLKLFFKAYFPNPTKELQNPYAAPLVASVEQLSGLPPALVMTAECDMLCDEGEAYATKLLEAGVDVVGVRILGTIHGFMTLQVPPTPQYRQGLSTCISFIKEKLDLK